MDKYNFEMLPLQGAVDRKEGIIRGVSVITADVQAKGHKLKSGETLHTDMITLQQMQQVGNEMVRVPVKWNHRTGADAVNGYLCNFEIKGKKLVADWVLMKKHERYEQALELAEEMPDGVGLSASFRGKSQVKGQKAFARCVEMPSVDLVATPAANPDGLFEEGGGEGCLHSSQSATAPSSAGSLHSSQSATAPSSAGCLHSSLSSFARVVDTSGEVMSDTIKAPDSGQGKVELGDVLNAVNALAERLAPLEEFQAEVSEAMEAEAQEFAQHEQADDHQFEEGADPMSIIEQRLAAAEETRVQEAQQIEFDELRDKVEQLVGVNVQLAAENKAMAQALQEFSKHDEVLFSAAGDDGSLKAVVRSGDGPELTDFEERLAELKSEGKDEAEAINFAVEEDYDRYQEHLEAKGVLA